MFHRFYIWMATGCTRSLYFKHFINHPISGEESTFDVNVTVRLPNGFILEWPAFNTSEMDQRKFLGYQVSIKEFGYFNLSSFFKLFFFWIFREAVCRRPLLFMPIAIYLFVRLQVFYKQVERVDANLSLDDDRSACSDSWEMHFEVSHLLPQKI